MLVVSETRWLGLPAATATQTKLSVRNFRHHRITLLRPATQRAQADNLGAGIFREGCRGHGGDIRSRRLGLQLAGQCAAGFDRVQFRSQPGSVCLRGIICRTTEKRYSLRGDERRADVQRKGQHRQSGPDVKSPIRTDVASVLPPCQPPARGSVGRAARRCKC